MWEFERVNACRLPPVLIFCCTLIHYSCLKRMYASSHSHSSAIHYSTLAMGRHFLPHPQWTEHHITTVDYNSYRLAHFSCAVSWAFMSQTLLWTLFMRLVMQQRTLVYMALNCLCISLQSCVESSVKGAYKQKCQISVCVTLDFKFQCQHWYDFALSQHTENCKLLDVAQKNPKLAVLFILITERLLIYHG